MNHCNFGHPCSRKMIESKLSQGRASKVMMRLGTMEREDQKSSLPWSICVYTVHEGGKGGVLFNPHAI